ncbi:MAG: hypothetical protein ACXWVJ_04345 [Caulobacteraceae bacterium]
MFLISLVLVILGVVSTFFAIPYVSTYSFWVVVVGYVVLVLGCMMRKA